MLTEKEDGSLETSGDKKETKPRCCDSIPS